MDTSDSSAAKGSGGVHRNPTWQFSTPQPTRCLQQLGVPGFDTGMFAKANKCLSKPSVRHVAPFFPSDFLLDGIALALFLCGYKLLENTQLFLRFIQLLEDGNLQSWDVIKAFRGDGASLLEKSDEGQQNETTEKLKEEAMCHVCCDGVADVLLIDCGHLAVCLNCSHSVEVCPVCRTFINGTVRLAIPAGIFIDESDHKRSGNRKGVVRSSEKDGKKTRKHPDTTSTGEAEISTVAVKMTATVKKTTPGDTMEESALVNRPESKFRPMSGKEAGLHRNPVRDVTPSSNRLIDQH